jgi:hypothetical protein
MPPRAPPRFKAPASATTGHSSSATTASAATQQSPTGEAASPRAAGIWNGLLFGGPTSPLTVRDTVIASNRLSGGAGVTLSGAGIYTLGFPTKLTDSILAFNRPDQCAGC